MKIIFFETVPGVNKLSYTISDETVKQLKANSVIPDTSKTLAVDYNTFLTQTDSKIILAHIDKAQFDNPTTPKKVILDRELLMFFMLEVFKEVRAKIFTDLDSLQMRALLKNKQDVAALIEQDKEVLRALPESLDYSTCITAEDIFKVLPPCLAVNYSEKYGYMLK